MESIKIKQGFSCYYFAMVQQNIVSQVDKFPIANKKTAAFSHNLCEKAAVFCISTFAFTAPAMARCRRERRVPDLRGRGSLGRRRRVYIF